MKKLLLIFILSTKVYLFSQEEDEEKKDYLISFDLVEEDDLYVSLEGYWKFDLSTAAEGDISTLLNNVIFKQTPDFTASLWLFNKFFFETQIKEKSEDNLFLFGYQNSDGILQEVRVGNSDINIDEYAEYKPPVNKQKAPGARIKVGTDNTTHEFLTRYTSEVKNSIKFRGYNQLEENITTINNYNNGNFFILPFSSIDNISVYYKKDNKITILDNQQYIYYKDKSLLYIIDQDITNIYTSINSLTKSQLYSFIDPNNINNPNPDLSGKTSDDLWSDYVINSSGSDYLIIKNRGDFSPFEHMGVYNIDNQVSFISTNIQVFLNGSKQQDFNIIDKYIVFWDKSISSANLFQRYPFLELDSDIYTEEGRGLTSDNEIKYSILTPIPDLRIPSDAKEGSVSVSINGVQDFSFDHNSDSGVITLDREISPFDDIVVNFDTELIPGTGNLLLSYGSKYQLKDNLSLELSQTGTWDFSTDDYSYIYNNNRGNFESRASLAYESDFLTAELDTLVGISNPDTLGKYLLFQYNQGNITLPIAQLSNDTNVSGSVSLIKRDTGDQLLTLAQIKSVSEDPTGGLYFANHLDDNSGSKVIVMETRDLTGGENSIGSVKLNDLKNDYSWARELTLEVYNDSGEARSLDLTFYNPGIGESERLTKTIILSAESGYKSYKINFTRSERSKITYLENIAFKLENYTATTLLIKNIKFTGDSLVTHKGSSDYTITKSSSDLVISQSATANSINISSRITPIDIYKYNHVKFSLNNSGIVQSGTNIILKLKSDNVTTGELIIPADRLLTGNNSIDIDLEIDKALINGSSYGDVVWKSYSRRESNSFNITMNTSPTSGTITLSNIILSEPKLSFYNKSSLELTVRPDISLKVDTFPVFDNIELTNINTVAVDTDTTYEGESEVTMDFIGTSLWTKIGYSKTVDNLEYKITVPYTDAPLMVSDSFSYNVNRKRENSLKVDTKLFVYNLILSDFKGDSQGLRDSTMKLDLFPDYSFNFSSESTITQKRDDEISNLSDEFKESYINLILEDNLIIENTFKTDLGMEYKADNWNTHINILGEFDQHGLTKDIVNNRYNGEISSTLILGNFSITPGIDTLYKCTIDDTTESNLIKGFNNFNETFNNTNPYKDISFADIFINNEHSGFYKYTSSTNKRYLDSNLKLNLLFQKQYNSVFAIFIPNSITYSRGKEFSRDESNIKTLQNNSVKGEFLLHPDVKNSVNFTHAYNLELEESEQSVEWLLTGYIEFTNKNILDLSNNLNINPDSITNLTKIDFIWPGKSGSVFILPAFNRIFDSPYKYTHKERFYLKLENQDSYDLGLRHETILNVQDINETTFYVDVGYNSTSTPLYFATGLTITLIF